MGRFYLYSLVLTEVKEIFEFKIKDFNLYEMSAYSMSCWSVKLSKMHARQLAVAGTQGTYDCDLGTCTLYTQCVAGVIRLLQSSGDGL